MLWATMKETAFWQDFWWYVLSSLALIETDHILYCREGMELATDDFEKGVSVDKYKSILGLYLQTADLEDPCDYSWNILAKVGAQHSRIPSLSSRDADLIHDLYLWMLDVMRPGLINTVSDHYILMTMENARDAAKRLGLQFFDFVLDICKNRLDAKQCDKWYAMLHHSIMNQDFEVTSRLVQRGANPHLTGFYNFTSPVEETPTSLALYTFEDFKKWKGTLLGNNVDLAAFAKEELLQNPLKLDGWNENTLLQVFKLEPNSLEDGWRERCARPKRCPRCAHSDPGWLQVIVDVPWQIILATIKRSERWEENKNHGKAARVAAVTGFYKYDGISVGYLSCYYVKQGKATREGFVVQPAQPPPGLPVTDYEWVCLKCWYEVETLGQRTTRLDGMVGNCITSVDEDQDDEDSSPFLLSI